MEMLTRLLGKIGGGAIPGDVGEQVVTEMTTLDKIMFFAFVSPIILILYLVVRAIRRDIDD